MDADDWNARYAAADLVWSAEPNQFVAEVVGPLAPGRALDVACGEGRNAIWLAEQGWEVTAVDFSDVAIAKAQRLAAERGVTVEWCCADVLRWEPAAGAFDLVLLCYLQLPAQQLTEVLDRAGRALAPGGRLLVIGHARRNLDEGVGGPQDPRVLYEPEDVVAALTGLEVDRAEHVYRTVGAHLGERPAIDTLVVATAPR